jgi:peptidoglycan/LPS O-acetylase OafA/YrhL
MDLPRILQAFSPKANLRTLWHRPGARYAAVDGLRALSMLWVVATHFCLVVTHFMPYAAYVRIMDANRWLFAWVLHGEKALDTFFVISGFLIGHMLFVEHARAERIDLRRFYARRYLRLMPAYGVALLVLLASGGERAKAPYVWANLLYVNNFLPRAHMFMDPSWSLAVEEQFYICLPLFLLGFFFRARRRVLLLGALLALSLVVCAVVLVRHPTITRIPYGDHFIACAPHASDEYFDALYDNLATRFAPFVLGIGLAWATAMHEPRLRAIFARPHVAGGVLAAGLVLLAAVVAVPAFDPHVTLSQPVLFAYVLCERHMWSFGVLLVTVAVLFPAGALPSVLSRVLAARVFYPIAQLSYCSYLFHLACVLPALAVVANVLHPGTPPARFLTSLGASDILAGYALTLFFAFTVGALAYLLVERPFLNLRPR